MKQRILRFQLVETLSPIWPFLKPEAPVALVAAATLGLTVVEVSVPILVGIFIDSLLSSLSGRQPATTAPLLNNRMIIGLLAVGALLRGYLLYQQRSLSGRIGQRVAARMRDAVWVHLQEVPLDYTRRRGPGRLLVRFISDTSRPKARLKGWSSSSKTSCLLSGRPRSRPTLTWLWDSVRPCGAAHRPGLLAHKPKGASYQPRHPQPPHPPISASERASHRSCGGEGSRTPARGGEARQEAEPQRQAGAPGWPPQVDNYREPQRPPWRS